MLFFISFFPFSQPLESTGRVHAPAMGPKGDTHLASKLNVRYHAIYRSPACPILILAIRKRKTFSQDWPQLKCTTERSRHAGLGAFDACITVKHDLCCHRMHDPELALLALLASLALSFLALVEPGLQSISCDSYGEASFSTEPGIPLVLDQPNH